MKKAGLVLDVAVRAEKLDDPKFQRFIDLP
jgi:hypothetical protein